MSKKTSIDYLNDFVAFNRKNSFGIKIVQKVTEDRTFDINIRNENGKTFLLSAAEKGWTIAAKLLLENKANPQIQDKDENTPLHMAAKTLNAPLVKLLIDHNATLDVFNVEDFTPIWLAVSSCISNPQVKNTAFQVLELLKHANLEARTTQQINVSFTKVISKDMQPMQVSITAFNMIPIFYVCTASHSNASLIGKEVAEKLLSLKPVNPKFKDSNGWGYMHWLISVNEPLSMLEKVYKQGGNVNDQDKNGNTCLHLSQHLNSHIIEWFVSHGADLNIINNSDLTPLSKICESIPLNENNPKNILFLTQISKALLLSGLKYGSIRLSIENFKYAYELKVLKDFLSKIEEVQAINNVNEDGSTYLHLAASKYGSALVNKLIAMKANVNAIDFKGYTPLHLVAATKETNSNCIIAKILILNEAEVHIIAKDGATPLTLACKQGNKNLVDLLLNIAPLDSIPCQSLAKEFLNQFIDLGLTSTRASELLSLATEYNMLEVFGNEPDLYN